MPSLLRIDCSPRVTQSHSRRLADFIESQWTAKHPDGQIIYRDLAKSDIPHISNETISGFHSRQDEMTWALKEATSLSDELIKELKSADELLISSPLYNLSCPSVLKAYIDQIVRSGHTFRLRPDGNYEGLLKGKNAYLALVMGAHYTQEAHRPPDFQQAYLRAILGFIGLEVSSVFSLEGTADPSALKQNLPTIHNQITQQFSTL
ncbi:MAG: FMN-dependent NADH-azoreductase [Roseivirga sp.]|nr:FMN-dependent NADH-azoreductase [Roseivirga sp.]